ncbi:CDP-glycerol glycerophosphotransferase family protein [Bacillus massilinigeriensis]|uniref:CDP-glycerol glycerophosphotransferase family protein n=1 Tax=Bacillus mediterraneensis TaxID=1805474 RepID=UPI0008F8DA26
MLKKLVRKIKGSSLIKLGYKIIFQTIGLFPADEKLIIFESYLGKQYSCNPRAIYECVKEQYPDYKLYWSIDPHYQSAFAGKGLETVNRFSIKWLILMARAKYWVSNSRLPLWIPKPKHTIYLQTWHGTPLKRLAADMEEVYMPGTTTESYKKNFLEESSRWDYLISPNHYSSHIFRRAFHFDKKMLETGYPRNDILLKDHSDSYINKIKKDIGIPSGKKVILYAPTWRDNEFYSVGKYKFDLNLDLEAFQQKLGSDYILLLRMHYLIAGNLDLSSLEGFAYDVSSYEDIRELYLVTDLLVTDYSSVFFDFANRKKPMFFYAYDIDTYRDKLRGFYFNFEKEAPGPIVKTTDELIAEIKKSESEGYPLSPEFTAFHQKFCHLEDGEAAMRVVHKLFG